MPALSWLAVRPSCPRCRRPAPQLAPLLELGVVVSGVAAILLLPLDVAVIAAGGGWAVLLALLLLRRR